ncbi:MAG TPA: glycosyltransferase [Anaeromyxobacteraceae bacterium]|nr:glycosyltransferase [Anaeromyxobacteraceae bacterium]
MHEQYPASFPVEQQEEQRHILTIAVEDYFQAGALSHVVQPRQWSRFEKRCERTTRATLSLLDQCGAKATFFVLGWIASELPELVREIVERGHEVASKGYHHLALRQMSRAKFREDLIQSREAIERAAGRRVLGYRIARGSFGLADLWALDLLAKEGFLYDSSFYPTLRSIGSEAWRRFPFQHRVGSLKLWEVPLSSFRLAGLSIPCAGGNYFRQLPHAAAKAVLREWSQRYAAPFVLHFHVWEMDPELPFISAAGPLALLRQHRNLGEMPHRIGDHLRSYRFTGIADRLGLQQEVLPETRPLRAIAREPLVQSVNRTPVTVVVPCYNEELVLPYLANTLEEVRRHLSHWYDLRFVFVDDGSTDETFAQLKRIFGHRPDCVLIQQPRNMGVAAAILAGIRAATTEVVCSIDCDCTYDPHQLQGMIPLFQDDVDMVTASPYHPLGGVMNVPGWRLALSKGLSGLYRVVLGEKLATFTSCFRVYRRDAFVDLKLENGGFLGVAEMLGLLSMRRAKIVEYPAVLEVRMLGRSKMKILRTIGGHLQLLARFARLRIERDSGLTRAMAGPPANPPDVAPDSGSGSEPPAPDPLALPRDQKMRC